MLLSSDLLAGLRQNISLCDYFGGIPFKWNKESNRLEVRSKKKLKLYGIRLYIAFFYKFLAMIQVVSTWKRVKMFVITHNVMFIASYAVIGAAAYVFYKYAYSCASLFNNMIEYEERHYKGKRISKTELKGTWLATWMVRLMTSTGILMPTLYHLDIIRNPCFPVYLGYWLSDQCQPDRIGLASPATWSAKEIGTKIGISLLSYMNWNLLMSGIPFFVNVSVVITGHCFRSYIFQYGHDIRTNKEMTKNGTLLKKQTLAFRELQLMSIVYRDIYSKFFLVVLMISCTIMQVVCLYNTVTVFAKGGYKDESFQIGLNLVYFWCTFLAIFIIVVMFGILADVYCVARNVHEEISGTVDLKRSKWFVRFLKSCPVLRIYLGGSNFLDEMTPLTCEDFAIDQTVSLLLLN
ncbi:unnamed protein product [Orchesella dallaii]|uniref:Gustatory receptor n=1 Tax=Orchesella dallaii TaxID=48710 RepID=A0ABP1RGW4_9HEXA